MTSSALDNHLTEVAERGYTILERVIEPAVLDALADGLQKLEQDRGLLPSNNGFEGRQTLRLYNLLVHGPLFEQIPVHPRVLPVVEGVLDSGCLVSSLSSVTLLPGERAQPIHADDQLIPIPRPHVPLVCNTMWALTDFTEKNGATRLVPNSHLDPEAPAFGGQEIETVPAVMPRGSVLVFNGSIWHGGGANQSQERRVGIAMNYCAGYMRQQENQQLGIPTETARGFSSRLRELVGYGTYNGLIGHIEKKTPGSLL